MGILVGGNRPHRPVSQARLDIVAGNLPDNFLVNAGGEAVDRDPIEIADHINLGGKWVDYCGYPMYYRQDAWMNVWQGEKGFSRFLYRLGLQGLHFGHTFRSDHEGFQYPRSLVVQDNTIPPWVEVDFESPRTNRIFSVFCIRYGAGMYFYAYGDGAQGINPYSYLKFISNKAGLVPPPPPPQPPGPDIPDDSSALLKGVVLIASGALLYEIIKPKK